MFTALLQPESLLFDFEAEDDCKEIPRPSSDLSAIGEHIDMLMSPRAFYEARLLSDVRQFKAAVLKEDGRSDIVVLATKLAAVGYNVAIRTAVGGGTGQQCFRNLHHVFLVIFWEGKQLIVEPQFRAQFCICNATPQYKALIQSLPDEWVGNQGAVKPLVRLLCTQMALAFESFQTATPPWRQQSSIISKWLPAKKKDRSISAEMASPHAGFSPTSTLTPPDSSSDSEAEPSRPDSLKAAAPQRKSLDLIFRTASAAQGATASDAWQIPSGTMQPYTAESHGLAIRHYSQAPALQQSGVIRKAPQVQGVRVASHKPSTMTKGFTVRGPLSRSAKEAAAEASHAAADQQLPATAWARAQSSVPQNALSLQEHKHAAEGQRGLMAGEARNSGRRQQEQNQQPGLLDLGLARRSASAMKLVRPSTRRDFFGQPAIHTVKLGKAH